MICVFMQCSLWLCWIKSHPESRPQICASGSVLACGGAQGPRALSLWHLFGFRAEVALAGSSCWHHCSHLSSPSCPSHQFGGEQPHRALSDRKSHEAVLIQKMGSNSGLMMKELSIWVGLALIKFTAWSYRHPGFNCGVSYSIVARKSWRLKIISVDNYEGDNPGWNLNYWVLLFIQLLMISNFFNFLLFLNGLHRFLVPQTNGLQSIYVVQIIFLSKSIFYDFWYCHWSIATCVCYLNN